MPFPSLWAADKTRQDIGSGYFLEARAAFHEDAKNKDWFLAVSLESNLPEGTKIQISLQQSSTVLIEPVGDAVFKLETAKIFLGPVVRTSTKGGLMGVTVAPQVFEGAIRKADYAAKNLGQKLVPAEYTIRIALVNSRGQVPDIARHLDSVLDRRELILRIKFGDGDLEKYVAELQSRFQGDVNKVEEIAENLMKSFVEYKQSKISYPVLHKRLVEEGRGLDKIEEAKISVPKSPVVGLCNDYHRVFFDRQMGQVYLLKFLLQRIQREIDADSVLIVDPPVDIKEYDYPVPGQYEMIRLNLRSNVFEKLPFYSRECRKSGEGLRDLMDKVKALRGNLAGASSESDADCAKRKTLMAAARLEWVQAFPEIHKYLSSRDREELNGQMEELFSLLDVDLFQPGLAGDSLARLDKLTDRMNELSRGILKNFK